MEPNREHGPVGTIDHAVLVTIEQRLRTASYVSRTFISVKHGKPTVRVDLENRYFHQDVEAAYLEIRWYTSGDFEIHHQENWTADRQWKRRWDRHPRDGPREHFHPPPDAREPPVPTRYPDLHFEVLRYVETEIIQHIRNHPLLD